MPAKSIPHGKYTMHPDEARWKFGVDRRTIFRWVEKGYLHSNGGLLDEGQVYKKLEIWTSTMPRSQARDVLEVDPRTVTSWLGMKILKSKRLFGQERITKASVDVVLIMPSYSPGNKRVLLISGFNPKRPFQTKKKKGGIRKTLARRRTTRKTRTKVTKHTITKEKPRELKIYVPKTEEDRLEIGTRRLVTPRDASLFLGVREERLPYMQIHMEIVGNNRVMYYANSVLIRGGSRG